MTPKINRLELRLDDSTLEKIDAWRLSQPIQPSRSEAARLLIQEGFESTTNQQTFTMVKLQVLAMSLTKDTKDTISDAYVFAWCNGVYPLYHNNDSWHEPFQSFFDVSKEMIDDLGAYLDEFWTSDTAAPTFYDLEKHYDTRHGATAWDRWKLIVGCRYMYLNGMFDDNLWNALLTPTNHPSEAKGITRPFKRSESAYVN
ncbi:hypothetical protein JCM17844_29260 [Iodidimonas gelatinilytica]|uniref:Uncharacterized protein n=1 Tax=Iodidimonas gelatinilytica TaxID=1236966 RepID=A0A5A7MWK4_9PROT|nr:hypothetical protein [Iodidimonas gelatinilytica]GEQ99289.1 hypothetical protein JCM17844_29260 [Iodidimonas gelatinilytica]